MRSVAPHLSSLKDDFNAHIFIGRKGSGKTLHLRQLAIDTQGNDSTISIIDAATLSEISLRDISSRFEGGQSHLTWKMIWKRSIISFVAALIYSPTPQYDFHSSHTLVKSIDDKKFNNYFSEILPPRLVSLSPVRFIATLAQTKVQPRSLAQYLNNPLWQELETIVARAINPSTPIYLFIDALDSETELISKLWHDCQYGLFLSVFELISSPDFGSRLHIVTTIRDSVYRSVLRTEHSTQYRGDSHVRNLHWGPRETEFFLSSKLSQLSTRYIADFDANHKTLTERWLGWSSLENTNRGIREDVTSYLIRHTRCLPRDVVILGNEICTIQDQCISMRNPFHDGHLRKGVRNASLSFARETMRVCLSEMIMQDESKNEYLRVLRLDREDIELMRSGLEELFRQFIRLIGHEIFTIEDLDAALELLYSRDGDWSYFEAGPVYRIDNIMWRNGLIAYEATWLGPAPKWVFVWSSDVEEDFLTRDASKFGFHPCLIDLCRLVNSGGNIVR